MAQSGEASMKRRWISRENCLKPHVLFGPCLRGMHAKGEANDQADGDDAEGARKHEDGIRSPRQKKGS